MYNIYIRKSIGDLYTMAKKKDITRNPPSGLEKGLFVAVILIIIAIAFPIFWRLNETTRQFYACVKLQNELQECIEKWREENPEIASDPYKYISESEMIELYGQELPTCPVDSSIQLFKVQNGTVSCRRHTYDERYD